LPTLSRLLSAVAAISSQFDGRVRILVVVFTRFALLRMIQVHNKWNILSSREWKDSLDRPLAYLKTFEAGLSATNHRVRSGDMFDLPCPVHNPVVAQHAYRDRLGSVRIAP
jgi:hypothetical protein